MKMASGFLFALLLSGLLAAVSACEEKTDCPASCPPGWTQFHCHCYNYHHKAKSWIDAEVHCLSLGGNLAPIHNIEEHTFIRNYLYEITGAYKHTWVGGTDAVKEGQWMWSDGSDFNYQRWKSNEPNNLNKKEHCLEINHGGNYWNDRPCTTKRPYVCAQDAKHDLCCNYYSKIH